MKAALHTHYHPHNISLNITEVPIPSIGEHEVLIKVTAAGVNPLDNMISRGQVNLITSYKLPQTGGNEVVGVIQKLGEKVKHFSIGERVFARMPINKIGAFAEYAAIDYRALASVPHYLTDVEAAAIPLTSLTAMQSLELLNIQKGKSLFISGGTGGFGAMAIPIAKAKGLTVITNGEISNKDRVLALGADQFLDYKTEHYSDILSDIDYVIDTIGGTETEKQLSILKKGGGLVSLRAMPNARFAKRINLPKWKQLLFYIAGRKLDKLAKKKGVNYDFMFVTSNGEQLQEIANLFSKQNIQPSIDSVYHFSDINKALDKVANSRSRGKTVITMET